MRKLAKAKCPAILTENHETWLEAYLSDKDNATKKFRYRHPEIKSAVRDEAHDKCIYCEAKVGHNTPGDIEHIIPTSKDENQRFVWDNLTLACTECNRRKSAYYNPSLPFINPYVDDVDAKLVHYGPIVSWRAGDQQAEVSVKTLELNSKARTVLILQKIAKLEALDELLQRERTESNQILKLLLTKQLDAMKAPEAEFSAMVKSAMEANT